MEKTIGTDTGRSGLLVAVPSAAETWLEVVERQVSGLKFGSVEITVHEGRVVQVETNSKLRFDKH